MQYVQLSSSLKHCIVDSRVLDLESLCIIAGSKVILLPCYKLMRCVKIYVICFEEHCYETNILYFNLAILKLL